MGRLFSRKYEFGTPVRTRNLPKIENRGFRWLLTFGIFGMRKIFHDFRCMKLDFLPWIGMIVWVLILIFFSDLWLSWFSTIPLKILIFFRVWKAVFSVKNCFIWDEIGSKTMFNRRISKFPVQRTSQCVKRTSGARDMACPTNAQPPPGGRSQWPP